MNEQQTFILPTDVKPPKYEPVRPLRAFKCWLNSFTNPNDTKSALLMQIYLHGGEHELVYQKFRQHPVGQQVIARGLPLSDVLYDKARLRAMVEGSLGRAYIDFLDAEKIDTQSLDELYLELDPSWERLDDERKLVLGRARGMHDLWHVVLGYGRDVCGEFQIMVFMSEQIANRSFRLVIPLLKMIYWFKYPELIKLMRAASVRGRKAEWLPAQDWETLLEQPLDEVRKILKVGRPPVYEKIDALESTTQGAV